MSNPTETGGHPLAPSIPHPQDSTHTSTAPRRRRRASQSSDEHASGPRSTPSRRRLGTKRDTTFLPHTGASRGDPSSTMQRSNSRNMSADTVHYTRTGRISKAKKGLKVHNCECGRSYTRAEHLRRHQKNHATDGALHCDYPDCGKIFFRVDLLQRHRERHEGGPESPQASSYSPGSTAESETHVPVTAVPLAPIVTTQPPYYQHNTSPTLETTSNARPPRHIKRTPTLSSGQTTVINSIPVDGIQTNFQWSEPFSHSPNTQHSSSGYASPIPPTSEYMFPSHPAYGHTRTRTSSNASFIEPWAYPSRSPTSTTSNLQYQWPTADRSPASSMAYINTSFPMTSVPMTVGIEPMTAYGNYGHRTMAQRDEEEQQILFPITEQPYGMGQTEHSYPFEQSLNNYWRHFHPLFPVVHRATFASVSQPPMLRAAMIAIDGQYSNDAAVKRKSRILHDRCIKLLLSREHDPVAEGDRQADWQALFLIEVLSQYRARRASKSLSTRFETMYHKFAESFRIVASDIIDNVNSLAQPDNVSYDRWAHWIDLCTQQRLLLCCYILEHQQATLLARQAQPSLVQFSGFDLPMPAHSSLWDASDPSEWALAAEHFRHVPQYVYQVSPDMGPSTLDPFQSSLLIAANYNHFNNPAPYLNPATFAPIDLVLDNSPITKHQLLTAKLLQVTPIRALLAVSGESWILSEKVTSGQAFQGYKATLRSWINGLWAGSTEPQHQAVSGALRLAIEILQHAIAEPLSSLRLEIGASMGLYFAALVLWSVTVVANSRGNMQQASAQQYRFHSQSPLPAARNFSITSAHLAPQTSANSPLHAYPPTGNFNPSLTSHPYSPTSESMPHAEAERLSTMFLNMVFLETDTLGSGQQWPSDATQWLQGCGALMCWVRMRLRGHPEGRDSVISPSFSAGPTSAGTGRGGDGCGELLDGVLGVLEKIMGRGWEGWGV